MKPHLLLALALLPLAGCFGPSSPSGGPPAVECAKPLDVPGGGAGAPRADAGYDYEVRPGDDVFLDGNSSSDPQGRPLTYHWGQVAGPCVALDLSDPSRPVLRAPPVQERALLRFQLVVEAGGRHSDPDFVEVAVVP